MAAKKKHKLYFTVVEGNVSEDLIKVCLQSRGIGVRSVTFFREQTIGAILFQKKEDREIAFGLGNISPEPGCSLVLSEFDSRTPRQPRGGIIEGYKVDYKISEIKIKTSFDMDTKTQHSVFFLFGKDDFNKAVADKDKVPVELEDRTIDQFKSLLSRRKANAEKVPPDPAGINRRLAKELPEDIYDGTLAYYHNHKTKGYLTYTNVPQKPYRFSPRNILKGMDKLACSRLDKDFTITTN